MATEANAWIDVSVPIRTGMVRWPGNPEIRIERREKPVAEGGFSRDSTLSLGAHTGTHVDAPIHFGVGAVGVDALPIDTFVGVARVVAIAHPRAIERAELEPLAIAPGERLLFKTSNSSQRWSTDDFAPDYVYVSADAARYLVDRAVRAVGVDYLSVASRTEAVVTHRVLLAGGVGVLEGLNLAAVDPGVYDLIALPLRVVDGDGAPARAVLRSRG